MMLPSARLKRPSIALTLLAAVVLTYGTFAPQSAGRAGAATPATRVAGAAGSRATILDKTKFVAHAGVAFFAFHHFVYARLQNSDFTSGTYTHRAATIAKAAVALLLSYHELQAALKVARKSKSPTLHALMRPLDALNGQVSTVYAHLHNGTYKSGEITTLNSQYSGFHGVAAQDGYAIKDVPIPDPSGKAA